MKSFPFAVLQSVQANRMAADLPEPSTWALLVLGVFGIAYLHRSREHRSRERSVA